MSEYSEFFLEKLKSVRGKRSRIVVDHIMEHGFITTEELKDLYGYSHPPRAVRDVREQGIPIETFETKDASGRTIAAYRFGEASQLRDISHRGRRLFPKSLKQELIRKQGERCGICDSPCEDRYLQVDHRIPFEVAGNLPDPEAMEWNPNSFMLLCGSCNRAKSWSCEHCIHRSSGDVVFCRSCYWSHPLEYTHIAGVDQRRLELIWNGKEILHYQRLADAASVQGKSLAEFVRQILDGMEPRNAVP